MSDDNDDDGRVILPFTSRVQVPDLDADTANDDLGEAAPAPAAAAPATPGSNPSDMAPPLHLVMPGVPEVGRGEDTSEGAFVGPAPEDPDAPGPSPSDALGTALSLMTAMGVAASQGMWHRSRQRKGHADHARAQADKARAAAQAAKKTGGATAGRTTKSASGGLGGGRRGSSGGGSKGGGGSRGSGGLKGGGRSGGSGGGKGLTGGGRRSGGSGGGKGLSGGGRRGTGGGNGRTGGARRGGGGLAPASRGTGGGKGTAGGRRGTGGGNGRTSGGREVTGARGGIRGASWFFRGARPGDGKSKSESKPADPTGQSAPGKPSDGPADGPDGAARGWKTRARWKSGHGHWMGFAGGKPRSDWTSPGSKTGAGSRRGGPGAGWMPPGADGMRPPSAAGPYRTWAEQVVPDPAAVASAERFALSAGTAAAASPDADATKGETETVTVSTHRTDTQYTGEDAELTIHDVIEADADMAEQIMAGVAEAQGAADGCDLLYRRLEELHARVVELRVPGALEGMLLTLMEQTANVRASAATIAERLPAASEAIATAGSNAESRHRPLADAVRDAGHARPAERDYHNE